MCVGPRAHTHNTHTHMLLQEIQAMRAVSDGRINPPASAPLAKICPSQAADVIYEVPQPEVEGRHTRSPAWCLPPNRTAMSKQWVSADALAYVMIGCLPFTVFWQLFVCNTAHVHNTLTGIAGDQEKARWTMYI